MLAGAACPRCQREPGRERATGPFARVRAEFLDACCEAQLTAYEHRLVLTVIRHTWAVRPPAETAAKGRRIEWWETSVHDLARRAGIARHAARAAVARLTQRGLLLVVREAGHLLVRIAPLRMWQGRTELVQDQNGPRDQNGPPRGDRIGPPTQAETRAADGFQQGEFAQRSTSENYPSYGGDAPSASPSAGEVFALKLSGQRQRRNPAAEVAGKVAATWGIDFRTALRAVTAATRQGGGGLDVVRGVVDTGLGACPLDPTSRLVALVRSETARAVRTQQEELAIEALPETVREPLRGFATRTGLPLLAVADRVEALLRTADADRVTAALRDTQGIIGWKAWDAVLAAAVQRQRAVQFWFASPSGRGEA
jgi:hypothetical protein